MGHIKAGVRVRELESGLGTKQAYSYLLAVIFELCGKDLIFRVHFRHEFRPIQRNVEIRRTIVQLVHFSSRGFSVLQQSFDGIVQCFRQLQCTFVAGGFAKVFQRDGDG